MERHSGGERSRSSKRNSNGQHQQFMGRSVESALDEILAETNMQETNGGAHKIVSVKSTRSPRKSHEEQVKDGFIKVTVSSGSNEVNHFSRSLSQDEMTDDDIFNDVSSVESEIVPVDFSSKQLSGERTFEQVYGNDAETKRSKTVNIALQRDPSPRDHVGFSQTSHEMEKYSSSQTNNNFTSLSQHNHSNHLPIDISIKQKSDENKIRVLVSPHQSAPFVPVQVNQSTRHYNVHSQQRHHIEYHEEASKIKPKPMIPKNDYDNIEYVNRTRRKSSLPDGMDEQEFRRQTELQLQRQKELRITYHERSQKQQQKLSGQQHYHEERLMQHQQHIQSITQQQNERNQRKQQRQQAKQPRVILNGTIIRRHSFDNTGKIEREDNDRRRNQHTISQHHDQQQQQRYQKPNVADNVILNGSIIRRHSFNDVAGIERDDDEILREIYRQELREIRKQQQLQQQQQQQQQKVIQQHQIQQHHYKQQSGSQTTSVRRLSFEKEIGRLEEQIQKLQHIEPNTIQRNPKEQTNHGGNYNKQHQQQHWHQQLQRQQDQRNHQQVQTFKQIPHSTGVRSATNTPVHHRKFQFYDEQVMMSMSTDNTPNQKRKRGKNPSNIKNNKFQSQDIINDEHKRHDDLRRTSNPNLILGRTEINEQNGVNKATHHSFTLPRSFGSRQRSQTMDGQLDSTTTTKTFVNRSSSKPAKDVRKTSAEKNSKLDELRMKQAQQKLIGKVNNSTSQFLSITTNKQKQTTQQQQQVQQQQQLRKQQQQKQGDWEQQLRLTQLQKQQKEQEKKQEDLQQQLQHLQQQQAYHQLQGQQQHKTQQLQQQLQDLKQQYAIRLQQHHIEETQQTSTTSTLPKKKNSVSFEDSGLNIINGSHVRDFHTQRGTKKSHIFTQLSRPKPEPSPVKPKVIESKPKYLESNVQAIKVQVKGGEISLIRENEAEEEWDFSDRIKQQVRTNMYGSCTSGGHYHYHGHHDNSKYDDVMEYMNTSTETALNVADNDESSEVVYYTVCTHYFKPENYDWIQDIHRMGKARVPMARRHKDQCVFWNNYFNPDKEEIIVSKLLVPEHENERKISTTRLQVTTDYNLQHQQQSPKIKLDNSVDHTKHQQRHKQGHASTTNLHTTTVGYFVEQKSPRMKQAANYHQQQHHHIQQRQQQQHYHIQQHQHMHSSMPNVQLIDYDIQRQQKHLKSPRQQKSWVDQAFDDNITGNRGRTSSHNHIIQCENHLHHSRHRKDSIESDSPFDTAFDARSIDSEIAVTRSMHSESVMKDRSIQSDLAINRVFSSASIFKDTSYDQFTKEYSIQQDYPMFVKRRLSQNDLRDEF